MTKTVYIAIAPNGTQHTRTTNRTYTHAVLLEGKEGWGAVGFCGRPDLAKKKCAEHPGSIMVECSVLGECPVDKPGVENAESTTPDTPEQPKLTIGRFVEELLKDETWIQAPSAT